MQPFFAQIIPVQAPGPVDPGYGQPAPGVPTHPIYNPPGIWPAPGVPTHPIAPGGPPPSVWPPPGRPTHPIYNPPGIWPPPTQPEPQPPHPEHPIVLPPGSTVPPGVGIWPDPGPPPTPEHPIVLPPDKYAVIVYVPGLGYQAIVLPYPPLGFNPPSGGAVPSPVASRPPAK